MRQEKAQVPYPYQKHPIDPGTLDQKHSSQKLPSVDGLSSQDPKAKNRKDWVLAPSSFTFDLIEETPTFPIVDDSAK
jgi:hypothetical protein